MLKKEVTVKDQFGTEYNIQATVDKSIVDLQDHSNLMVMNKENLHFLFDLKYMKPVFYILKSSIWFFVLCISIILTSIIHNDVVDTILTILNFFIVFRIIFVLHVKIIKSIFEICSP